MFPTTWKPGSSMAAGLDPTWPATRRRQPGPAIRASQPLAHRFASNSSSVEVWTLGEHLEDKSVKVSVSALSPMHSVSFVQLQHFRVTPVWKQSTRTKLPLAIALTGCPALAGSSSFRLGWATHSIAFYNHNDVSHVAIDSVNRTPDFLIRKDEQAKWLALAWPLAHQNRSRTARRQHANTAIARPPHSPQTSGNSGSCGEAAAAAAVQG